MSDALEFQARMQHLDTLLDEAERENNPASRARVQEIVRILLDLHADGLHRLLGHLAAAGEPGAGVLNAAAGDAIVSPLLLLHGLHPLDLESRVKGALEKVKPYLASHGGHVQMLSVSPDGVVNLRLEGSCHGCPSSRVTLQTSIEQEILTAAPEVTSIVVEGLVEHAARPGGFVPVDEIAINGVALHAAAS